VIKEEQLESVKAWLSANGGSPAMEMELRGAFDDLHFTFCSDDDVASDKPVAEVAGYALYLVDSSQHCLCLTTEPESASGLVVAEIEEED
jgi:hypothetical protein